MTLVELFPTLVWGLIRTFAQVIVRPSDSYRAGHIVTIEGQNSGEKVAETRRSEICTRTG